MKTLRTTLLLAAILTAPLSLQAQTIVETLKTEGTSWDFLLYRSLAGNPLDPYEFDLDYHTTWQTAAGYDGPPLSPAPAILVTVRS